ncbi:3-oxoacyl-[acyl-carrier-protein] synthase III C-terminal domain-containing protein, partial [Staphylococcus aureus]|uniref:3-oxoacyl-[acyl-carrier-protein] synthase III C-terminal domain-containing protein n=1 Tax=Staphylococcus aureus TaxID=1280 RepID=UPI0037DA4EA9
TRQPLPISKHKITLSLNKYPNTSPPSIPLTIHQQLKNAKLKHHHTILLLPFPPPLTSAPITIKSPKYDHNQ